MANTVIVQKKQKTQYRKSSKDKIFNTITDQHFNKPLVQYFHIAL